jgi:hypothetical protein
MAGERRPTRSWSRDTPVARGDGRGATHGRGGFSVGSPGESRVGACWQRRERTTDTRVEQGLEVDPTNAVGDGGGERKRGDALKAARVGNTLEGVASAGMCSGDTRQRSVEAET